MTDLHDTGSTRGAGADGPTRRELMLGGAAAGAAAAVVAAVPPLLSPAQAVAAPVGDVAVLLFAIRAEQVIIYAYGQAVASGLVSAAAAGVLTGFLGQEHEHVAALSVNLERLGGALPIPPSDPATFALALRSLGVKRSPAGLHNQRQWITFLADLEIVLARVYRFAIEQLADSKLIQTASQIMANEAQHATLLRQLTSPGRVSRTVPTAFVGGAK